jgi:hypothetical protein
MPVSRALLVVPRHHAAPAMASRSRSREFSSTALKLYGCTGTAVVLDPSLAALALALAAMACECAMLMLGCCYLLTTRMRIWKPYVPPKMDIGAE